MLSTIKKGDRIITSGGIYGEVTGVSDTQLTIEIAPKIRVKVARSHVAGISGSTPAPAPEQK